MFSIKKNINTSDYSAVKPKNSKSYALLTLSLFMISAPTLAGWEVQWIDKFNGKGVNWQNWTAQVQANYNNEVQCYTDDETSTDLNYDVSNGSLKIIARKQAIDCPGLGGTKKSWTSGRLNSKDKGEFLYGRIESRIKFHNLEGGTWPAFWMLENRIAEHPKKNDNDFIGWPQPGAGEIDVWEWFANQPNNYITNFFNTGTGCGTEVRYNYPNGGADVLDWHKYAMEWDQSKIRFYIDDHLVTEQDVSTCGQYKEPMFILLNVAMGGNLGGSIDNSLTKATLEVDYVAHCTATTANSVNSCDESTPINLVGNDDDNDGIINSSDLCSETPAKAIVDESGCAAIQGPGPNNKMPVALATGQMAKIYEGEQVQLSAASSYDPDEDFLSFLWTQTGGPGVTLSDPNSVTPTFTAPSVDSNSTVYFKVEVSDGYLTDTAFVEEIVYAVIDVTPEPEPENSSGGGSQSIMALFALLFASSLRLKNRK